MSYKEFCKWLEGQGVELSFDIIGNNGVNGRMNFVK